MLVKKLIAIVAATVMVFGLLAVAPASAQTDGDDYVTDSSVGCDDATPTAGDTVECQVTACDPGATVVATIDGAEVGSATADANGDAVLDIAIAEDFEGDATVLIDGCGEPLAVVLAVQAAPDLAFTGSDSLPTALIAVVFIAFGAVLALGARRYQLAAVNRNE